MSTEPTEAGLAELAYRAASQHADKVMHEAQYAGLKEAPVSYISQAMIDGVERHLENLGCLMHDPNPTHGWMKKPATAMLGGVPLIVLPSMRHFIFTKLRT